jgi:predicted MFS family arabinose efflux permease
VDRRKLLIWTNALSAFLALMLAALRAFDLLHVWHIVAVSAASGVIQAIMSPASTSLLPAVVGEADVPNAIALNSLQFNLSRVVGPAFGGIALVYLGAAWSFALNALSFLVLAAALARIGKLPTVPANAEPVSRSIMNGLRFVRERSDVRAMLLLVILTAMLGAPVVSMLPALVKSAMELEAASYSVLLSCFGAGAVIAAMVSALHSRSGPLPWLAYPSLCILGLCQIGVAFDSKFAWVAILVGVAGFAFVGTMIRLGTALLLVTPDEFRGRVTSLQQMSFRFAQPVGALAVGVIASIFGIRIAFWAFGGLLLGSVALLLAIGFPSLRQIARPLTKEQ